MKKQVLNLLEKYKLSPKKYFGQNFLIDKQVLNKIIQVSDIKRTDNILEIGPGLGFLTKELAQRANKIVTVEIDPGLYFVLKQELKKNKNIKLIKDDILQYDLEKLKKVFNNKNYKIVANLPYQITSHFLKKFLIATYHPEQMTLMVQKEVAERICAKPGAHSLLSLSAQFYCQPEIIQIVNAESFFPKPKVNSAIIKLKNIKKKPIKVEENLFFRLLRIGFSAKRKQLQNNLANGFHENKEKIKDLLEKTGISAQIRAQQLGLEDWQTLYEKLIKSQILK